eukprot:9468950-Ditylum_brightwellii.AAC.2
MKSADVTMAEQLANMETIRTVADNMAKILDTKYCKVNLQMGVIDQCTTLNTKRTWNDFQYNVELRDRAKLYHSRLCPEPKAYKATLCMEVECLCKIG